MFLGPEPFTEFYVSSAQSLDHIEDPAERRVAERGKYIFLYTGCQNCHTAFDYYDNYAAGGLKYQWRGYGEVIAPNLTSDEETGLGRRSDEEVMRVLRSGLSADGRIIEHYMMPWVATANLTEEDRYALLVYLRNVEAVRHQIPPWSPRSGEQYQTVWGRDYGHYPEEDQN